MSSRLPHVLRRRAHYMRRRFGRITVTLPPLAGTYKIPSTGIWITLAEGTMPSGEVEFRVTGRAGVGWLLVKFAGDLAQEALRPPPAEYTVSGRKVSLTAD